MLNGKRLSNAELAFYQECALLAGVSFDDWLASAEKGEF